LREFKKIQALQRHSFFKNSKKEGENKNQNSENKKEYIKIKIDAFFFQKKLAFFLTNFV
jgi:hypothetical protein